MNISELILLKLDELQNDLSKLSGYLLELNKVPFKNIEPLIEGKIKSNIKNNKQRKRLAPSPPPIKNK